jgi:inorganic pyrophosphatase
MKRPNVLILLTDQQRWDTVGAERSGTIPWVKGLARSCGMTDHRQIEPRHPRNRRFLYRPHPWHGLSAGPDAPRVVSAYIEMTPIDRVKYEIDKETGLLVVDRPKVSSSQLPSPYGFIPRTLCGDRVAELTPGATSGDNDALDICVLSEQEIARSEVLLTAHVVGGFRILDNGLADDKIVAVLTGDLAMGDASDISDVPGEMVDQLWHYFSTYKEVPEQPARLEMQTTLGREDACRVVQSAMEDYADRFGEDD